VILDVKGNVIKTLVDNENKNKGNHFVDYNLKEIPQGNYYIKVYNKNTLISKHFIKIK
jgi:hypothetical protein